MIGRLLGVVCLVSMGCGRIGYDAREDAAPVDAPDAAEPCVSRCVPMQVDRLVSEDALVDVSFGYRIAGEGDRLLIGDRNHVHTDLAQSGAAFVFAPQPDASFAQMAELLASDSASQDWYGQSVGIEGRRAVVGTWRDYSGHDVPRVGAAYVYEDFGTGVYEEVAVLTASDGVLGDDFGYAVGAGGTTAIVGARHAAGNAGAAYVFERQGDESWPQTSVLVASDGVANAGFGDRVLVSPSGARAFIGAYQDTNAAGTAAGAVYVFDRQSDGSWMQSEKLVASDAAADDRFGVSLASDGEWMVIGAFQAATAAGAEAGAAYVFERQSDGSYLEVAELTAADGVAGDRFGTDVAVSGTTVLVGAFRHDVGGQADAGAAYVFRRDGAGEWAEVAKLTAAEPEPSAYLGISVAIVGDTFFAGAPNADGGVAESGVVYAFRLGS